MIHLFRITFWLFALLLPALVAASFASRAPLVTAPTTTRAWTPAPRVVSVQHPAGTALTR